MKYLSDTGVKYLWSKIKSIASNENMLINTNFKDPINQRAKTSYTSATQSMYTIDRWLVSREETLSIEDGYIRVKRTTSLPYLLIQQNVEMIKDCVPDTMTLSFKIRASKKAKMQLYDTNRYFEVGTDWSIVSITFTKAEIESTKNALKDTNFSVYVGIKDFDNPGTTNLPVGTYMDIEWVKLEASSTATKYHARSRAEEIILCQRYYEKFEVLIARINLARITTIGSSYTSSYFKVLNGSFKVSKYGTPTFKVSGSITDTSNNAISATASDFKADAKSIRQLKLSSAVNYFDIFLTNVEVDSEIY